MQLVQFFIVCMDRHKKIQVTNTQIYVCVLYSMKERAVTGITWLPGVEGQRSGLHCLSKATIQSLFPPLPRVTLSNNKKH